MHNKKLFYLALVVLMLVLAACQPEAPSPGVCPINGTPGDQDEDCLPMPSGDELGAENQPGTMVDLDLLMRDWRLSSYSEDGLVSNPPLQTLSFSADGGYTLTTETEIISGSWSSSVLAAETTLVLDPGTGQTQPYQVINLNKTELNLRTWRGDVQIDEVYQPGDAFNADQ